MIVLRPLSGAERLTIDAGPVMTRQAKGYGAFGLAIGSELQL